MPINKMHLDFPFSDSSVRQDDEDEEDEEECAYHSMHRSFDTQKIIITRISCNVKIVALSCVLGYEYVAHAPQTQ